ncbi:unnamed protein product [Cyprideis torosa]|uniref:Uncharacterized protein n=1 Tax=Cyprideis torosa TaxID=163714 RepID=A0A7R8ZI93_9CRUS|nr:unnamed protein product [Cyprideis torosa]CAG0885574.1 unnamed protein product [Cyprideis torosa]
MRSCFLLVFLAGAWGSPTPQNTGNFNPCVPSPCGRNTRCEVNAQGGAVCKCLDGFFPKPDTITGCDVQCRSDGECGRGQACINSRCTNPCERITCGRNAFCTLRGSSAVCECATGYRGNPYSSCEINIVGGGGGGIVDNTVQVLDSNTACLDILETLKYFAKKENVRGTTSVASRRFAGITIALILVLEPVESPGYFGNPTTGCRAECESDTDCASNLACRDLKCVNPCVGTCGENAECEVVNHQPNCRCPQDYLGNPFTRCYPECTTHQECPGHQACINLKCGDPCVGACGTNANCRVENHKAICSCPKGFTGHPFDFCRPFRPEEICIPNPCGVNAQCAPGKDNQGNDRAVCTCPEGYIGDPLRSCTRGECITNNECPDNRACVNYNCVDPCATKGCGINAQCLSTRHAAVCSCPEFYEGDPLTQCTRRPEGRKFGK